MKISALAFAAAVSLSTGLSACNQTGSSPAPATPKEQTPVADTPAPPPAPAADDAFARAVNFECEGGGKVDLVFDNMSAATARIDGGPARKLTHDDSDQSGMSFKDATTSVRLNGDGLGLTVDGKTRTCTFKPRELSAPKADGVVRTLTVADKDANVEIKVGEKVAVSLVGVPTAGYLWAVDNPPAFVKASEGPGGPTSSSQMLPGFTGGNHWEVTLIEGVKAGSGEITVAQRRPWEKSSEPAVDTFKFKLTVK